MDIPWILQEKGKHDWGDKLRIKVSNQKNLRINEKDLKIFLKKNINFQVWHERKIIKI